MRNLTTDRNREIFSAHADGSTVGQLAEIYDLAAATISAILVSEKHKLAVSVDDFYRHNRKPAAQ
ncbi:MAG: hypothetical protein ABI583_14035 [Betaproteobacteria bacterium]